MQSKTSLTVISILVFTLGTLFGYWATPYVSDYVYGTKVDDTKAVYIEPNRQFSKLIELPAPDLESSYSIEEALANRRTRRDFDNSELSVSDLSQMLWAAQGITDEKGHRTAPSGHSVYPIELFVAISNVKGVDAGLYVYLPEEHRLGLIKSGEQKTALGLITDQPHPQNAPVSIFMSGNYTKPLEYYDINASKRATLQESGHIGQNLYLQAESLDLAMVVMGGFDPIKAREMIGGTENDSVIYLVPIGNRVEE